MKSIEDLRGLAGCHAALAAHTAVLAAALPKYLEAAINNNCSKTWVRFLLVH